MIDDRAWAEHILRLEMRGGIGDLQLAVKAELVKCSGSGAFDRQPVPAVRACLHRMDAIEHQFDALRGRRPKLERHSTRRQKWTELSRSTHISPENTKTARGGAMLCEPAAYSLPGSRLFTVSSTGSQRLYSGNFGKVNSISSAAAVRITKRGD